MASVRAARATRPGGGEAPRECSSPHRRAAWLELCRRAGLEPMRCFGPSASQEARHRRDELEEAFGEGYDEAEEARIFALEELARQQSELEEAFGEGYDPEEEARLFAEEDAVPPEAPPEAPLDFVRGNEEGSLTRRRDASEDERETPPATVATSPRTTPKALPEVNDESARVTTLESSRSTSEEPPTEAEETEPPSFVAESSPNAPAKTKVAAPSVRSAKTFENATNEKAASFSSLPPLDLGDPEKYRRLRETLGVEAALRVPLAQLLAPLEATTEAERGREKGNPDLFVPLEMPRGLLLPFAQHEAYGRLKLREIQQEDGSVGYATLAADGDGAPR
jgi:hypothetical protein